MVSKLTTARSGYGNSRVLRSVIRKTRTNRSERSEYSEYDSEEEEEEEESEVWTSDSSPDKSARVETARSRNLGKQVGQAKPKTQT